MFKKDSSVYLLAGSEQFFKEEHLAKIKSAFLDKKSADFNFHVFYPGAVSAGKILECAYNAPFLAPKRVVLVYRIEEFSASDRELILSYARAPQRLTLLVLETAQANLNEHFFSELCKYARLILCRPLKDSQTVIWIEKQLRASGKTIEETAAQLLLNRLGSDLKLLLNSLESLMLYAGQRKEITAADVEQLVGRDLTTNVFDLFDAVITKNSNKAFAILDSLFKDGLNSPQILGALTHQVISKRDRIGPSLFERCLEDLQRTDSDIKTGRQSQKIALELLLAGLLNIF